MVSVISSDQDIYVCILFIFMCGFSAKVTCRFLAFYTVKPYVYGTLNKPYIERIRQMSYSSLLMECCRYLVF